LHLKPSNALKSEISSKRQHVSAVNRSRPARVPRILASIAINGEANMISFKSLTAAALLSALALAGSPALATQIACHDASYCSREQTANTLGHSTFAPRIASHSAAPRWKGEVTTHDNWPANMILG
jgi:hypothetical protein